MVVLSALAIFEARITEGACIFFSILYIWEREISQTLASFSLETPKRLRRVLILLPRLIACIIQMGAYNTSIRKRIVV